MKKVMALLMVAAMLLTLAACGVEQTTENQNNDKAKTEDNSILAESNEENDQNSTSQETEVDAATERSENTADTNAALNGIRPEFKEAMDAYEAFYDEYCDILQKYYNNPSDMALLVEYSNLMAKAVEMDEAFTKWESEDMSNEELKYYLEVNNRVMQKMVDIMG